jgi:hypothetical protein
LHEALFDVALNAGAWPASWWFGFAAFALRQLT